MNYSKFVNGLTRANVIVDRKILSELAVNEPETFKKIFDIAKSKIA